MFGVGIGQSSLSSGLGTTISTASLLPNATVFPSFGGGLTLPTTTGSVGAVVSVAVNIAQSQGNVNDQFTKVAAAVKNPVFFGDERDAVLTQLQRLSAFAGCGKGFFAASQAPVEFNEENAFYRFKTVSFSRRLAYKNEDGYVGIVIKKSASDVEQSRQLFVDTLFKAFGARPQISVSVEGIKPLPQDRCKNIERLKDNDLIPAMPWEHGLKLKHSHELGICEVIISVTETVPSGVKRRALATEVANLLMQPQIQSALCAETVTPKMDLTSDQLKQYLTCAPNGMDSAIWIQAQANNPDTNNYLPVPVFGFGGLYERAVLQTRQTEWQSEILQNVKEKIRELSHRISVSQCRLEQMRTSQDQASSQLIKILCRLHAKTRQGFSLDENEEVLKSKLESVYRALNSPLESKGHLLELASRVRSAPDAIGGHIAKQHTPLWLDTDCADDILLYLKRCQEMLETLVQTVNSDLSDLSVIKQRILNDLPLL